MHLQLVTVYPHAAKHIQKEREGKKYESRDVPIHTELPIMYPYTETDREKKRERKTPIKRSPYRITISDNIAEH